MKKKFLALFLAAAMVGAVAGCSQNGVPAQAAAERVERLRAAGNLKSPAVRW